MCRAERAASRRFLKQLRRFGFVAVVAGALPTSGDSQQVACPVPVLPVKLDGWFVDTRSAALIGDDLMLFGQYPLSLRRTDGTVTVDTMMAGVAARGAIAPRAIPLPRPGMRVHKASVARVSNIELRVVFRTESNTAVASTEQFTLWTGRLLNGAWGGVREVGVFHSPDSVEPEMASGIVVHGGHQLFAFAQAGAASGEVLLVRMSGDSVSTLALPVPFAGLRYPSLAVHDGRLWLSMTGINPAHQGYADVWFGEVVGDRIHGLRPVVEGGARLIDQPKLVPTGEGLLLAWLVEASSGRPTALEWKVVTDSAATVNSMPARWPFSRGASPFEHLVAVPASNAPVAQIIQLLPEGMREVASIENQGFYPTVVGWADRLFAASTVKRLPGENQSALGIFDIGCGLGVTSPPDPSRPRR